MQRAGERKRKGTKLKYERKKARDKMKKRADQKKVDNEEKRR